jgi:hypothetical protein
MPGVMRMMIVRLFIRLLRFRFMLAHFTMIMMRVIAVGMPLLLSMFIHGWLPAFFEVINTFRDRVQFPQKIGKRLSRESAKSVHSVV